MAGNRESRTSRNIECETEAGLELTTQACSTLDVKVIGDAAQIE